MLASFQDIAAILKAPKETIPELQAKAEYVKLLLTEWSKRWVLIFDGYDDNDFDVRQYFPQTLLMAREAGLLIARRPPDASL